MLLHILVLRFVSCTLEGSGYQDKPFPNDLLPLSQNEYWCITFHMEMSLISETINGQVELFPYKRLCASARFETEGKRQLGNNQFDS